MLGSVMGMQEAAASGLFPRGTEQVMLHEPCASGLHGSSMMTTKQAAIAQIKNKCESIFIALT
jgi:hypothetical protein